MKKLFFSALLLGAALSLSAQSKYDHYYEGLPIQIEHVQEVKFPATSVNIAQFGAVPDGKTECTEAFKAAIKETKYLCDTAQFKRHPIAWELWMVIKRTPLNVIDFDNYTVINDYTCDIDITEMDKYLDMEGSEND